MHSFLVSLLPSVIQLRDYLVKEQAAIAGIPGSDVYASQMAYGHIVPSALPKVLPFVATNYKAVYVSDPGWIRQCFLALKKSKKPKFGGDGGTPLVQTTNDSFFPHFVVGGPAKFIRSMRLLCASPDLDPHVIALLYPDGGTIRDSDGSMAIPLVKQTNAIIAHAQEEGMPAVIVHPRDVTAHLDEKEYMIVRFNGLCQFLISLPKSV
mmetsp:Transcript_11910/g.31104  ORF Transcript_11910/g.31104 Transcript_11910/m.31104 type:complete len:208 (+) Transcript_11910:60-683(+)